jgi:hypothetical protein
VIALGGAVSEAVDVFHRMQSSAVECNVVVGIAISDLLLPVRDDVSATTSGNLSNGGEEDKIIALDLTRSSADSVATSHVDRAYSQSTLFGRFAEPSVENSFCRHRESDPNNAPRLQVTAACMALDCAALGCMFAVQSVFGDGGEAHLPFGFFAVCCVVPAAIAGIAVATPTALIPLSDPLCWMFTTSLLGMAMSTPVGSIVGGSTIPWMCLAYTVSFARPTARSPLSMWTLDLVIGLCSVFDTVMGSGYRYSNDKSTIANHLGIATSFPVVALFLRLFLDRVQRNEYETSQAVLLQKSELDEGYHQLEKILEDIAPAGVEAELLRRQARSRAVAAVGHCHPLRSTASATSTYDAAFAVIGLKRAPSLSTGEQHVRYQQQHEAVTTALKSFGDLVTLVKSVGDVVLVSAHGSDSSSLAELSHLMISSMGAVSQQLCRVGDLESAQSSFRIFIGAGQTMGTILGSQSQAFEWYGGEVAFALHLLTSPGTPLEWGSCVTSSRIAQSCSIADDCGAMWKLRGFGRITLHTQSWECQL